MANLTINSDELKNLIEEALINVLLKRRDLIEDAVIEAIEDMGIAAAIEEGKTGDYINSKDFLNELNSKISSL